MRVQAAFFTYHLQAKVVSFGDSSISNTLIRMLNGLMASIHQTVIFFVLKK